MSKVESANLTKAWPKLNVFPLMFNKFSVDIFNRSGAETGFSRKTWLLARTAHEDQVITFAIDG